MTAKRTAHQKGLPKAPRPKQHLFLFRERHPYAFKLVDAVLSEKGGAVPDWPDWCFLPFEGARWILYGEDPLQHPVHVGDTFELCALAGWRTTQRIYRPAPELIDEAYNTDLDWRIPDDLFTRLPEWCVYIETPDTTLMNMPTLGFFAYLVTDSPETPQLRLLFDVDDTQESRRYMRHPSVEGRLEGQPRLFPFAIDHSVKDLREGIATAASHVVELADHYWEMSISDATREIARGIDVDSAAFQYLWPVVLLDRICSSEVEYRDAAGRVRQPANPRHKKAQRGPNFSPPLEPTMWRVRRRS